MNTKRACRICGTQKELTRHRLVPRVLGGTYRDTANVVVLCNEHHRIIDSKHPLKMATRRKLRTRLTANEETHVVAAMGERWLAQHYPAGPT